MSFQQGLSGLSAASQNLDVVGNNIANANTVGYKQSRAEFTDILANSLGGGGASRVGIGAKVATVSQSFDQGNISPTSNPLDMAINGQGFFRFDEQGVISYSRNGQFRLDNSGYLVSSSGANLTGYAADATGAIDASKPVNLKLTTTDLPPKVTTEFEWGFTLDSNQPVPAVPTFSALDGHSYTHTKSATIYDSLGNPHALAIYFQKTATPGTWETFATVDGKTDASGLPVGITLDGGASATLTFDGKGDMTSPAAPLAVSVDLSAIDSTLGADTPLDFTLDLTTTKQYGSGFNVNLNNQDGYAASHLAGFSALETGEIQGIYSNGKSKTIGQIVLANFVNPQGLAPIGEGRWVESQTSGQPLVGEPKSGTLGVLQSSAVEDANVDLTTELVKMITAQRMYQANAKTIETQDSIMQTIVNI